jgi:hypothetical protein
MLPFLLCYERNRFDEDVKMAPGISLCWLRGTSVRQVDGFALDFFICLEALVLTHEGVQEHFPYLLAFPKAIFYLSVGSRENVCFKHAKNNTAALSTQSSQVFLLRC